MVRSPAMSTATMARSAAAQQVHRPPLPRVLAQPLRFLETLRADGRPVVPFRLGSRTAHLVTEPELIAHVLEEATAPAARRPWYLEPLLLPHPSTHPPSPEKVPAVQSGPAPPSDPPRPAHLQRLHPNDAGLYMKTEA